MNKNELLKLQNGSDIRGIATEGVDGEEVNLTPEAAEVISRSYVGWLSKKTGKKVSELVVGVGRDSRISGEKILGAVVDGIICMGAKAVDCGIATTPAMFMSIIFEETKFDGAIMVTASHLPFNRNGLKFFDADGGLEHDDIYEILDGALDAGIPGGRNNSRQEVQEFNLIEKYSEFLVSNIRKGIKNADDKPLRGLKIIVDAGNGAGGFFASKILAELGADTQGSQFLEPDGRFPNHIPNPENKEAMKAIKSAVVESNADLGLIFDTDVDRMSAVLPGGKEVNRDAIIALMAAILSEENPGSTIITDSVTSDRLTDFLEKKLGLKHHRYKRGYKNVINECKKLNLNGEDSPLAMETSGHGALKENYYLDDGAFLAVKIIIAMANARAEGKKLEDLIKDFPEAVEEKEIRFKVLTENFKIYEEAVLNEFRKRAIKRGYEVPVVYEGVRISFRKDDVKGWVLLRKSLHEPVMPMNIEGARPGDADKILEITQKLLKGFKKLA